MEIKYERRSCIDQRWYINLDNVAYVMAMKRDQDLQIEQAIALIKALPAADRAKIRRQLI